MAYVVKKRCPMCHKVANQSTGMCQNKDCKLYRPSVKPVEEVINEAVKESTAESVGKSE